MKFSSIPVAKGVSPQSFTAQLCKHGKSHVFEQEAPLTHTPVKQEALPDGSFTDLNQKPHEKQMKLCMTLTEIKLFLTGNEKGHRSSGS